ncbi:MAG: VCBS repeat-containing protein [Cyclobacteriaceae bacterium]|nr:VCBS repeat-containing protein [Cyclobacteriaceae bacterium]
MRTECIGTTVLLLSILLAGCTRENTKQETLFTELTAEQTGVFFENKLRFDNAFNIYTYRNFYNGGGVACGDINNDGLIDLYFTSNQGPNKLYLNKGNLRFEDITDKAGVAGKRFWSTGVTMADVNGDGLLDIYVCNSGDVRGGNKQNELFINNGDLTFTDRAEEYGVADPGFTTHAAFFDYDRDGDLDLYILNNSYQAIGSFNLRKNERPNRDALGGDKLMRNDGNRFTDVSEKAGIYSSVIGFGLGVTVGDVNNDGWSDIYISNDFFERDYLYINNQDGTFSEVLTEAMPSISNASMGADFADINNDGWLDLFVTDMLPKDNNRIKTVTTFEDWNRYQYSVQNGYHHQFTRNTLQLNNRDGTFSEISRMAGVEASDWSWGALIFDMDNDGLKDIFVANGIFQDLTDQDFLTYASSEEFVKSVITRSGVDYKKLTEIIPSVPVSNCAFRNNGKFTFTDKASEWGLARPMFSNGSAFADLDNDGDLDLILNNVNMPAVIYRNNSTNLHAANHFLQFNLKGEGLNTYALGTRITVYTGDSVMVVEQMPTRGFQSSVDPRPFIGLGNLDSVPKIIVQWPRGKVTVLQSVKTNQVIHLHEKDGEIPKSQPASLSNSKKWFGPSLITIPFVHQENSFNDFDRDRLLFHMMSNEGPKSCIGDVNNDGLDDFFIGGARGQAGQLFIQQKDGTLKPASVAVFEQDRGAEDTGCTFFDADRDGDLDLYVCSGGNELPNTSTDLIDRLYLNDGKGNFTRSPQVLPTYRFESTSVVRPADIDLDGDLDLFVGCRMQPATYGPPANGIILQNDGKGIFTDVTASVAPQLNKAGMITDAAWADMNKDGKPDLIIAGEWMGIRLFINNNGTLTDTSDKAGFTGTSGWWNVVRAVDLNHDGYVDIVAGNHGLNSRFRASVDQPVEMYVNDFDNNGTLEHIITVYNQGKPYPMVLRHDLVSQMPYLKKKYLKYENYRDQQITNIFTTDQVNRSLRVSVSELRSMVYLNSQQGVFTPVPLPPEAQFSNTYALLAADFNGDNHVDLLIGGNNYRCKPEAGRYDASYGLLIQGHGDGTFRALWPGESGFRVKGEIRDLQLIKFKGRSAVLVIRNNDSPMLFFSQF